VSHNTAAVTDLCSSALFLNHGQVKSFGNVHTVVNEYISSNNEQVATRNFYQKAKSKKSVYISEIFLVNHLGLAKNSFLIEESIFLIVKIVNNSLISEVLNLGVAINDFKSRRVIVENIENLQVYCGMNLTLKIEIPILLLTPNEYLFELGLMSTKSGDFLDFVSEKIGFVIQAENTKYEKINYDYGVIHLQKKWNFEIPPN
jgi:hypothetical protein